MSDDPGAFPMEFFVIGEWMQVVCCIHGLHLRKRMILIGH